MHGTCLFLNPVRCCHLKGTVETSPLMLVRCSKYVCLLFAPQPVTWRGRNASGTKGRASSAAWPMQTAGKGPVGSPAQSPEIPKEWKASAIRGFIKLHLLLLGLGFFPWLPHGQLLFFCHSRETPPSTHTTLITVKPILSSSLLPPPRVPQCLPTALYHRREPYYFL